MHELVHAICGWGQDNCGRKDHTGSDTCIMTYRDYFILNGSNAPQSWTNGDVSYKLCTEHIDKIRKKKLEDETSLWTIPAP